MPGARGQTLE